MRLLLDEMYPATIAEQLRASRSESGSSTASDQSTTKIPPRAGTDLR